MGRDRVLEFLRAGHRNDRVTIPGVVPRYGDNVSISPNWVVIQVTRYRYPSSCCVRWNHLITSTLSFVIYLEFFLKCLLGGPCHGLWSVPGTGGWHIQLEGGRWWWVVLVNECIARTR